jgi:heme-degrading monooxygenase HmoA
MAVVAHLHITYQPDVEDQVSQLVREAAGVLKTQNGFQELRAYRGREAHDIQLFITWERQEDHEACQRSPQWLMLMPVLSELMEADALQFKLAFCDPL